MIRKLLAWLLLPALAFGLLSLGRLAPVSDLWDKVFSWVAVGVMLIYLVPPTRAYHRARWADQSSRSALSSRDLK
jgi:hypothetical protein